MVVHEPGHQPNREPWALGSVPPRMKGIAHRMGRAGGRYSKGMKESKEKHWVENRRHVWRMGGKCPVARKSCSLARGGKVLSGM